MIDLDELVQKFPDYFELSDQQMGSLPDDPPDPARARG
jgi:hypothetical protein